MGIGGDDAVKPDWPYPAECPWGTVMLVRLRCRRVTLSYESRCEQTAELDRRRCGDFGVDVLV